MLNIILLRNTCIRIHLYVKEADQKHQKVEKSWNKMVSRKKTWDKIRHIMGNTIGMLKTYWIEMKTQTELLCHATIQLHLDIQPVKLNVCAKLYQSYEEKNARNWEFWKSAVLNTWQAKIDKNDQEERFISVQGPSWPTFHKSTGQYSASELVLTLKGSKN